MEAGPRLAGEANPATAARRRSDRRLDELDAAHGRRRAPGNCTAGSAFGAARARGADRLRRSRRRAWRTPRGSPRDGRPGCATRAPPRRRPRRWRARSSASAGRTATTAAGSAAPGATRARPGCRRRAGAGCSRCRARPGSPRARRARRCAKRSSTCALSSRRRPATKVLSSAHSSLDLEPGDVAGELVRMRADVADAAARARARRVGAPLGLLLAGGLERLGQPVLRVLDLDHADLAEQAVLHHLRAPARTIG